MSNKSIPARRLFLLLLLRLRSKCSCRIAIMTVLLMFIASSTADTATDSISSTRSSSGRLTMEKEDEEASFYSLDGRHNNQRHPEWGAAGSERVRILPNFAVYYNKNNNNNGSSSIISDDAASATSSTIPRDEFNSNLPSARRIMEQVFSKVPSKPDKGSNQLLIEFGHFMVQDMIGAIVKNSSDPFPMPCDGTEYDLLFCPVTKQSYRVPKQNNNISTASHHPQQLLQQPPDMKFFRTQQAPSRNNDSNNGATVNRQTAFLDMSNLYGTSPAESNRLRELKGGRFALNETTGLALHNNVALYNTSPGAYVIYVLFYRFHNHVAANLCQSSQQQQAKQQQQQQHEHLHESETLMATSTVALQNSINGNNSVDEDDEALFQCARRYTIAVYQSIVEEKYLTTLLGFPLPKYQGYNSSIDPRMDEFFTSLSFRYAHSSLSRFQRILDDDWQPMDQDPLLLREIFKQEPPNDVFHLVERFGGIEPFLRGLTVEAGRAVDAQFVEDVNVWSLATSLLDVQRGRDVGLPPYNQVRKAMGLPEYETIEELVGAAASGKGDEDENTQKLRQQLLLDALNSLYQHNISQLDAYVGALIEPHEKVLNNLGPLFSRSIENQFARLRDGDRFWYKNLYSPKEYEAFESLAQVIEIACPKMNNTFPKDSFRVWNGSPTEDATTEGTCSASSKQLSLLGGDMSIEWQVNMPTQTERRRLTETQLRTTIDVALTATGTMNNPGYLGVGWRSSEMKGAEIWFCTVNATVFDTANQNDDDTLLCPDNPTAAAGLQAKQQAMFSCCLAPGKMHVRPQCAIPDSEEPLNVFYKLEVVSWCLSSSNSIVTVRAPVCESGEEPPSSNSNNSSSNRPIDCFRLASTEDGKMDFIVAFNLNAIVNHGYMKRTSAQVDLNAGFLTEREAPIADEGLIATHAVFMLIAWMLVAPASVFIVRYLKTRSWRLVAHVSLMGFVGSLMIPLLIGIEASVGASDKLQGHSVVGLTIMFFYFAMAFFGRIRYLVIEGRKVGRKMKILSLIVHRYGGFAMIGVAWWNCYTGLVRIGPEDSYFQIILLGNFPLGYDMDIFGFIRQYVFFPYIAIVCLVFVFAEARRYKNVNSSHKNFMENMVEGKASILSAVADEYLEKMTMKSFLEITRMGTALCIVDGYVLDITQFIEMHPGGQHLLRYATGSDITEMFVGRQGVDGHKHVHSREALELMKTLVKAVLVDEEEDENGNLSFLNVSQNVQQGRSLARSTHTRGLNAARSSTTSVFRSARLESIEYLTPSVRPSKTSKPVIMFRLAVQYGGKNSFYLENMRKKKALNFPSCAFTFRGVDDGGLTIDRQYTPLRIATEQSAGIASSFRNDSNEEIISFIISLVPGGKMSKYLLGMKRGKLIRVQGPTINPVTVETFKSLEWKSVVMICAGTGIAPMIQVIDFYLSKLSEQDGSVIPKLYLLWVIHGPEYNYAKSLGLDEMVMRSQGRFTYIVVYSSRESQRSSRGAQGSQELRRFSHGITSQTWNFESMMKERSSIAKLLPGKTLERRLKVKKIVTRSMKQTKKNYKDLLVEGDRANGSSLLEQTEKHDISISSVDYQPQPRTYNRELIEELLLSIPEHDENKTIMVTEQPLTEKKPESCLPRGNETCDHDRFESEEKPGATSQNDSDESSSDETCSDESSSAALERMFRERKILLAISGAPMFEYETQAILREIGFPKDQTLTFHSSSTHI